MKGEALGKINKKESSIIKTLKDMFSEELDEEDWRNLVKDQMVRPERNGSIRDLKDYDHIERGLYHRLHGEIMSRCVNEREGKKKQKELHEQTYGIIKKVIFY